MSRLLYDPPRSLSVQAYAPLTQQHGHVNVDGTGVAWWPTDDPAPLRYVTTAPPWADPNLPDLAPRLTGRTILAAVRGATPGVPFSAGHVAPFVHEGLAFAHNGFLAGFRTGTGRALLAALPDDLHARYDAVSDSLLVFLTIVAAWRDSHDLTAAVRSGLATVARICRETGEPATLNVLLCDGDSVVATRASLGFPGNSLVTLPSHRSDDDAATVASESLDPDLPFTPVPDDHLVRLQAGGIELEPLTL